MTNLYPPPIDMHKKVGNNMYYLTLELNAPLQPFERHDMEDIITEALEKHSCGYVDGGGTAIGKNGEITSCDIHISLNDNTDENMNTLLRILDDMDIPNGSFLRGEGFEHPVGNK